MTLKTPFTLTLSFLITLTIYLLPHPICDAQTNNPASPPPSNGENEKEKSYFLQALKKKEIENQIRNSDVYKLCKLEGDKIQKAGKQTDEEHLTSRNQAISTWFNEKMPKDPQEIKKLTEKLDPKNYFFEKNKDSKALKDILTERINKAIHGPSYKEEDYKTQKLIGQDTYVELFKAQLGKNLLLEISGHCLENLRFYDSKNQTYHILTDPSVASTIHLLEKK